MSQTWYVKQNGKTFGPIAPARLKQLSSTAKINPETRLRLGDDGNRVLASKVKGLFAASAVSQENATRVKPQHVSPATRQAVKGLGSTSDCKRQGRGESPCRSLTSGPEVAEVASPSASSRNCFCAPSSESRTRFWGNCSVATGG